MTSCMYYFFLRCKAFSYILILLSCMMLNFDCLCPDSTYSICLFQVNLEQLGILVHQETEVFQGHLGSLVQLVFQEIMDYLVLLDCRDRLAMWDYRGRQDLLGQQEFLELQGFLVTKVFLEIKEMLETPVIPEQMPAHRWDPKDLQVHQAHKALQVLLEVRVALVTVELPVTQDRQVMLEIRDLQAPLVRPDQRDRQVTEARRVRLGLLVLPALQDSLEIEDNLVALEILAQPVIKGSLVLLDRMALKDRLATVVLKERQALKGSLVLRDREGHQVSSYSR